MKIKIIINNNISKVKKQTMNQSKSVIHVISARSAGVIFPIFLAKLKTDLAATSCSNSRYHCFEYYYLH